MEQKQTIFERMGGTYTPGEDGMSYPDLALGEDTPLYGKYGYMRKRYLQQHRPALFSRLVLTDNLVAHLNEVDDACNERMEQAINAMAQAEGVTETLKASNQLEWVRCMNSIQHRAEETVCRELFYEGEVPNESE